jgi:hypothetical protein
MPLIIDVLAIAIHEYHLYHHGTVMSPMCFQSAGARMHAVPPRYTYVFVAPRRPRAHRPLNFCFKFAAGYVLAPQSKNR